jgi:hypothetical protein
MDGSNTPVTDRANSLGNLVVNIRVLEHRLRLALEVLSLNPFFKILLVSLQDFVVSFVHLECAPLGCSRNIKGPITINNDAHSRSVSSILAKNCAALRTSPKISEVFSGNATG